MPGQVNIIGGSIAGLIAGRELAGADVDVTIYEEHREIGVPEKCDGLVSSRGMAELGIVPPASVVQNRLEKAVFFSPSQIEVEIDARKQNVVVMDRARFDKYLAERAAKRGARIEVGKRVAQYSQTKDIVTLKTDSEVSESEILLDCSGYESYVTNRGRTLQGGQYLVYGNWFEKSTVEVYVEPKVAPGFFIWVIPLSSDTAKVGVAGSGINTFHVLDGFVREKGGVVFRKMAAPLVCSGVVKSFVDHRIAKAGDSAGQAKPTTGGGIYTGGLGGLLAGEAAARAIKKRDPKELQKYEEEWRSRFGNEFRTQLYARNAFSKMTGDQIDRLFEIIKSSDLPQLISEEGDFDRHSIAIMKALGLSNFASAFGIVLSNELRSLFH